MSPAVGEGLRSSLKGRDLWRCGSHRRAPALQSWSPEFKSQSNHKQKFITKLGTTEC
jgi:hypothetical protein